jgi:serine/threonine-protein kinase PknG
MLGLGLVQVPPVRYRDPSAAIMTDPRVAESKRYCGNCGEPVGRGRDGTPGRTEGFCRNCGTAFSFSPKLKPGDLVAGQYEVLGCLAHGGLGWIYLARDRNVSQRWVVLKGLLDTGDTDALTASAAERAHLAEAQHANIVKIYNFVEHRDPRTGAMVGYIVMEYVGGQSLKDILLERRALEGPNAALPLPQVIAYALELLRALDYLHGLGVLYCDLKPDNAIQSGDELKLIDLGGVRGMDDHDSAIFGTVGYQAPEIAERGPTIASEIFTVGRTLAVLSFPFKGYTGTYATTLPPRADVDVLARHESYDRLLRRATHPEPEQRFADADEMSDQLVGVLREVLAAEDGQERPGTSNLFGPERYPLDLEATAPEADGAPILAMTAADAAAALPVPLVDGADPAAGFLAGLTARGLPDMANALSNAPVRSPEVTLMLARVHIELGQGAKARRLLDEFGKRHPGDWRIGWYRGLDALAHGGFDEAATRFDEVYARKPGEAAVKLACAVAHEQAGRPREAARLYDMVWRTDRAYVSAAFGLARAHLALGDRAAAIAVLDSVPPSSSFRVPAQVAAVATAVRGRDDGRLTDRDLLAAGQRLDAVRLDPERRELLATEVCEAALRLLRARPPGAPRPYGASAPQLLGVALAEDDVRRRLERGYRELAGLTRPRDAKAAFVNRANAVRPRTLL